jgi:D-alanyl-lipoteichoic acid acyltransferase DltB (MBOAT superfamily)
MLFTSAIFVFVYLPITGALYYLAQRLGFFRSAIAWLALSSVAFYAYWDYRLLPVLGVSITVNFFIARFLDVQLHSLSVRSRKFLLVAGVSFGLLVLTYYKYAGFLVASVFTATGHAPPAIDIVLPLGISFYTFTQIAYLVDTYKTGRSEHSLSAYVLFVTFFPHLIAGPLLHHADMMPQFTDPARRRISGTLVSQGAIFFFIGLIKKVIVADSIAPIANRVFSLTHAESIGFADSWLGALAYAGQIYFDFSGYSDMAVGVGLMLGIRLPYNFNSPYQAVSISDFWRRWHITLSRFLRDYLYIVLGGNRHGPARRHLNLFLTMLLGGLWHGASWTFVAWGALHGVYLQINHAWRHLLSRSARMSALVEAYPRTYSVAGQSLTFLSVVVAWVFFRAETFTQAWHMLGGMFSSPVGSVQLVADARSVLYVAVAIAIAVTCPNSQAIVDKAVEAGRRGVAYLEPFRFGALCGVGMVLVGLLVVIGASRDVIEFIYFNF